MNDPTLRAMRLALVRAERRHRVRLVPLRRLFNRFLLAGGGPTLPAPPSAVMGRSSEHPFTISDDEDEPASGRTHSSALELSDDEEPPAPKKRKSLTSPAKKKAKAKKKDKAKKGKAKEKKKKRTPAKAKNRKAKKGSRAK